MRISQRLIFGFLAIAMWVAVVGHISLYQLNRISEPLNSNIPESVESIGKTAYLDGLAQLIRYYHEVLTQSARNYAFTQDKKWQQRYEDFRPELVQVIKNAIDNGEEKDREIFLNIEQINFAHAEMESKSIELVNNGQPEQAIKILESSEYWDQKETFEQNLGIYVSRRGIKYDEALSNSTKAVNLATKQAQDLITTSQWLVLFLVLSV